MYVYVLAAEILEVSDDLEFFISLYFSVKKIEKQCQLIEIKKIMLKYKLKNIQVSDLEFENSQRLWYFILSQDKVGCMEDALKVMEACKLSVDEELYRFRLRRLISQEKLYEYMELLNSLPSNMALTCGKRIVNFVKVLLEDEEELDPDCNKTKQVYTEAALVTSKHLMSLETDYGEVVEWKKLAFEFQNLWSLQVEYDKYLSVSQYEDEAFRMEVMVSYMKEFFIKRSKQPENSDYCYGKVYRLADILQISHTKLQGELAIKAAKTGSIETAIKMCNKLLECHPTEETAETIYQVALAFLNLQANTENDLLEANQLRDLPEITYKLACQPLSLCSSIETKYDLFSKCMELCKCAYLNLNVSRQCELGEYSFCVESSLSDNDVKVSHDKDWKIDSTFKEDALVMKSSVALPLMAKYSVAHPVLNEDDNSQVDESTDNIPMSSLFRCFIPVMQHLKDNSHILLAYQYALHMISIATDYANRNDFDRDEDESNKFLENIEQNSQTVMKELLTNILTKIFNCNHVDHHLALAFLLSRPKKECLITLKKIISMSGHNYKKLRAVATVGLAVGQVYKEPSVITMCKQLETNAVWGYKLSKYKINFKEAFLCPPIEKIKLLPQVVQVDTGDMTLVKDFCSAFGLDTDEGIMLYLDHVFSTYNEDDHVSSSQLVNQLKNARIAIQEIKKTDSLFEKLELLYTQVHSYDYETLEFLLEEMQKIEANGKREKGLKLLDYLKVYTRTVEPSEYERKYRIDGDKQKVALMLENLPVASKTRLPFHPFIDGDPWKILTPELRKDTVSLLLPIAELLKIPVDQIYIVSVQNMVRQHLAANRRPDDGTSSKDASKWNWDVKDANLKLLDDVKDLLTNVSNCELALACASWMTLEMPAGAEKIKGLEGCLALATLWHNALPPEKTREKDKAKAAYGKFSSQWQRLSTEQALCLGKLAEPELLKLANNAEKLLQKLYEHPSILLPDGADKPDIHTTAEKVAEINGINLQKLLMVLVEKWLPCSSSKDVDADSTMTFNFTNIKLSEDTQLESDDADDENLKRLLYVLRKGPKEESIVFLLNYSFKEQSMTDASVITHMCRVRALRCLLELRDFETIEKLSKKSAEDLRSLMKNLSYIVDLESLHIQHSVETFEECNKEGLVKGIWRNHSHQKTAAFLVASLCLDYHINDKQLWNSVLQQLHSFSMMKQLEYVLLRLGKCPDIWQVPSFPKLWQSILTTPLTKVVPPLTEDQLDTCIHVFNLINRCPVLQDVNLVSLSKMYQKLELPACALACLSMVNPKPEDGIKAILNEKITVLDNAQYLLQHGLDATLVKEVKNNVFDHIISEEDFVSIVNHNYFLEFVGYCVMSDSVDGLLKFSIIHNRVKDAVKLFNLYCSHHPEIFNTLGSYVDDDDGQEEPYIYLKAFLNMKNMSDVAEMLQ